MPVFEKAASRMGDLRCLKSCPLQLFCKRNAQWEDGYVV